MRFLGTEEIWCLLGGREEKSGSIGPGTRVRKILKNFPQRKGFGILWMVVRQAGDLEYVEVWVIKGKTRYNLLFQKISPETTCS
ncbi:hypothetical protein A3L08_00420 [Thermococcus pacificus]|uniref:Uncharacterized protein n=1 Tax=Thermococcus pacificus TaxID=71998 RepID=A0A218P555_9EURY|nr:hypothetical protein A3L08_00420 [Thermococcus pacificus]